jgi:hypothetical protein
MKTCSGFLFVLIIGCSLMSTEPYDYFYHMQYELIMYSDTAYLSVHAESRSRLNYQIRNVKGFYDSEVKPLFFKFPMSDTLTLNWFNRKGEKLSIPFQMNTKVFNAIDQIGKSSVAIKHPGDIDATYNLSVYWSECDSTSNEMYSHGKLDVGETSNMSAPRSGCKAQRVWITNQGFKVDSGTVKRSYEIYQNNSGYFRCPANGYECILLN